MPQVETPAFLEIPEAVWVRCLSFQGLANDEIACAVQRLYGDERVVITLAKYFDEGRESLRATAIADVEIGGCLVDFPSGDRVAVPSKMVTKMNGSPL